METGNRDTDNKIQEILDLDEREILELMGDSTELGKSFTGTTHKIYANMLQDEVVSYKIFRRDGLR